MSPPLGRAHEVIVWPNGKRQWPFRHMAPGDYFVILRGDGPPPATIRACTSVAGRRHGYVFQTKTTTARTVVRRVK